ncbi:MAG TPA: DUF2934 domain-containing protein [Acetobacteraceae bacterium]|nr:DUF2934 domain-containing protein [Acetobacteraceae bacterium]
MSGSAGSPANDEIARVAHAIWEAEGRPEGRDHEHWMRARRLIDEGRAEVEYPQAAPPGEEQGRAPRPVQPGFEDAAPGMVPKMKVEPADDLQEDAGGRFAKQLAELPDGASEDASGQETTPGPRNPDPEPPTNAEGYVAVPSEHDIAGRAVGDDPRPPAAESPPKPRRGKPAV